MPGRERNLKQEQMILGLFKKRSEDMSLPKGLREFNKERLEEFSRSIALRDKPPVRAPRAFEAFLDKL